MLCPHQEVLKNLDLLVGEGSQFYSRVHNAFTQELRAGFLFPKV